MSFVLDGSGGWKVRKVCGGDSGENFIQSYIQEMVGEFQVCAPLERDVGDQGLDFYHVGARYQQVLESVLDRGLTLGITERRVHERNPQGGTLKGAILLQKVQ